MAHDSNPTHKQPLINPKELFPAAVGIGLGVLLIVGFVALAFTMGLTMFVDHGNVPRQ
jgi:hypothetical protein